MNKTIKLIITLAINFNLAELYSQDCVQDISTKPSTPHNSQMESLYSGAINPWKNTFNIGYYVNQSFSPIQLNSSAGWQVPDYTGGPFQMANPFDGSSGYSYLNNPVGSNPDKKDFHWEDGWELMWLGTGFFPNGEGINTSNNNRIITFSSSLANNRVPYMVYYNRYTGRLRIFSNIFTDLGTFGDINTYLSHPAEATLSGIFRHVNGYDLALDQYSKNTIMEAYNKNLNNSSIWYSAEYQLGYDPCVCKYPSTIKFEFKGIKTFNLNLEGRSISSSIPLKNSSGAINYDAFLANRNKTTDASGNLLYKSLDSMLYHYDKDLTSYNLRLKDYNNIENQLKRDLIKLGREAIGGLAPTILPTTKFTSFLIKNSLDIDKVKLPKDSTQAKDWTEGMQKALKSVLGKGYDELSYSIFGKEFFKEPQRPTMPSATFTNMRLQGTISDTIPITVANFMTPGTYQNSGVLTAHNYPVWNNPVGLFAMLKTPTLLAHTIEPYYLGNPKSITSTDSAIINKYNDNGYWMSIKAQRIRGVYEINNWAEFKFRLNDILHYRLNHAVDIDFSQTKVYGLLEIELANSLNIDELAPSLTTEYPGTTDTVKKAEYEVLGNFEFLHGIRKSSGGTKISVVSQWIPMDDIGETLFQLILNSKGYYNYVDYKTKDSLGFSAFSWKMSALDYIEPLRIKSHYNTTEFDELANKYKIKKIKLKMMPDIYFHQKASDNNTINTVQVFTYLLYADSLTNNHVSFVTENVIENKTLYSTVNITNITIGPSFPYINQTIGNNLYINANEINISGNINSMSGYNVFIRAKYNINIAPLTVIAPNISIEITDRIFNKGKIYEASSSEVESFCFGANKEYQANVLSKKDPEKYEEPSSQYQVISYPNPVQDQIFIDITNESNSIYNFIVHDLAGKVLIHENKYSGPNPSFELNISSLAKGMYILEVLSSNQKTYKSKFIKL